MKKSLFVTLIAATMLLTGCLGNDNKKNNSSSGTSETSSSSSGSSSSSSSGESSSGSSSSEEPDLPVGSDVTIYLDLGQIGLYNGQKGQAFESMFLENAVKLDTKVGAALPGKDVITSTSGAEFSNWMVYEGNGAPTRYDVAPAKNNTILLANWSGGSGGGGGGGGEDPEEVTYTINNLPTWITNDGCVIFAWVWSPSDEGSWHATTYTDTTTLTFKVDGQLTGLLLARCVSGTTEPSWSAKGNNPGRVYNQTNNIDCSKDVFTYSAPNEIWKEYNPS